MIAPGQDLAGVLRPGPGDVRAHEPGGLQVASGIGRRGEAEDGGRVEDHRHAVGDQGPIDGVAGGDEVADHPRDRIRHPVGQVDAGVAEADPGEGGRQEHLPRASSSDGSSIALTR